MKVLDDFDFTPRRVEQNEELDAVAWAENNGWLVRKMKYIGRNGCADRFFFGYGVILPVEFKNPKKRNHKGGGLSSGQVEERARLLDVGVTVNVCYTKSECIELLTSHMGKR